MLPRTATQTLTTLLCAWVLAGCGAEGTDAPFVEREAPSCVRFDDAIASTLSTIEQGKVLQIEIAMEALAAERGDAVEGLLQGLLAIIAEMWQAGLKEHPEVLLPVGAVLHDFDALIASVMRFLAVEEPTQLDAREALSSMISECPQGSLTRLVALVVTRPDLIRALSESANDPAVSSVLLSLSDGSGQSGEEGFVALVRTAVTLPLQGAGMSIVAFSLSSVIRASSAWTMSPSLTSTSITSMESKLPMSGTRTSLIVGTCFSLLGARDQGLGKISRSETNPNP